MNKNTKNKLNNNSGHIVIMNTLFFLAIALAVVFGIAGPITSTYASSKALVKSKEAFLIANSASEEALYRMKTGKELASTEVLSLAGGSATINVGDQLDEKVVSISSEVDEFQRKLQVNVEKGVGVSFNYGLQSGRGGFEMSGGAGINGNVYSNGNIIGSGGPFITGSATVANKSNPESVESNNGPDSPPQNLNFGGNNTPQDAAQSFQVSTTTPVTSIQFYIKKSTNNWMNNISPVRITTDNNGKPSKTTLASGIISAQQVTTAYNYITVPFDNTPDLTPGDTYWIVFDTGTTWGSYYSLGATPNDGYSDGKTMTGAWEKNNGGSWSDVSPSGLDIYFNIFVGGETGIIEGITIGSAGGDAWAHEVSDSQVYGDIYCQAGNGNINSSWSPASCDTSRPDPVEQPMPISDGNIEEWKNIASAGTYHSGDMSFGGNDYGYIGPGKIEGDLNIGSGATVEMNGTTWVTGDVNVSGGALLKLGINYGSGEGGILVTDGRISMTGGGQMEGTGEDGSYILAVTTSQCPDADGCGSNPAIKVTGGTGSVVLNAQQGTIVFSGGASAKQATGYLIEMSGGTTVDYEEGLADTNFSSGPSGSWNLISWDEVE